jgi:hypothetical protein
VIRRAILAAVALALITVVSPTRAAQQHLPSISCRRLYDEQKKRAFGGCDRRVVEQTHAVVKFDRNKWRGWAPCRHPRSPLLSSKILYAVSWALNQRA